MLSLELSFIIIIIILIIYIYYIQYKKFQYEKVFLDDLLLSYTFKTGDIILFKAYNNFNSIILGSYYGHLGVIYMIGDTPYIFESNGIENMHIKQHHNKNGVFFSKLEDRVKKYKGRTFLKALNKPINPQMKESLNKFIQYALENMKYDTNVFSSRFKKYINGIGVTNATNCAEIAFLSLLNMGLLDISYYNKNILHYLLFMTNLTDLSYDYKYTDVIEIIDHPFDY